MFRTLLYRLVRKSVVPSAVRRNMSTSTTTEAERREAAAMREGGGSDGGCDLPGIEIDDGTQKYVLIQVGNNLLVRGNTYAEYHKDAAASTVSQLRSLGVDYKILGGGRIEYNKSKNTMKIYGFSYGFPWRGSPQHESSAEIARKCIPGVTVTCSNEGY